MPDDDIIVEAEGGIGGIGAGAEPPKRRRVAAPVEPEPEAEMPAEEPWPRNAEQLRHDFKGLGDLVEAQRQVITQLQGQMGQVEQGFQRYNNIIQTLDQRMVAIARQVARNTRRDALELAIKSHGGAHVPTDKVTAAAASYLAFLEPPAPEPVEAPPVEGFVDGIEPEEPPQTTH